MLEVVDELRWPNAVLELETGAVRSAFDRLSPTVLASGPDLDLKVEPFAPNDHVYCAVPRDVATASPIIGNADAFIPRFRPTSEAVNSTIGILKRADHDSTPADVLHPSKVHVSCSRELFND